MAQRPKPRWTIATARKNLPTLIGLASREPQDVYRRDTLVARVVAPGCEGAGAVTKPSLGEAFAELRRICAEEKYSLPAPRRSDRRSPFSGRRAR